MKVGVLNLWTLHLDLLSSSGSACELPSRTCIKSRVCLVVKCAKLSANMDCSVVENFQGLIGMHAKLCHVMPMCADKE